MRESAVHKALLRELGHLLMIERVENRLSVGFPDVVWTGLGLTGVFELKDDDGTDWVSAEQALWLRRWAAAGGLGGILAKATRGPWSYYPAQIDFDWVRAIQKRVIAPAQVLDRLDEPFLKSLALRRQFVAAGEVDDPRRKSREDDE